MSPLQPVRVFLVGAGPGDPALITRRGLDLIRSCDVLLYDRLVARSLIGEAPAGADKIFVGKRPGETSMPQAAIDRLIVDKARAGNAVVRLKGGDPFVFGRGADEGQALAAAGIAFEIVPGISAAVAVPAYAGIPVTHSGVASSFAVLTAHESARRPGAEERFAAIAAGADTLVLLMGASSIKATAARLIEAGRSPNEPVALVERGTTPRQRTLIATLATVGEVAESQGAKAPVTTVVGPVVKLRDALEWFERRPLFGRRIVLTRPRVRAASLAEALEELGAEVIALPTIAIADPDSFEPLDEAIDRLSEGLYEWVLFASANAVERFFGRLLAGGRDARALGRTKLAAVGSATAAALRSHGVVADLVPDTYTAATAAAGLGDGHGRVLIPRPARAPGVRKILGERGWQVDEVVVYRTEVADLDQEDVETLRAAAFDAIAFTSASTVRNLVQIVGGEPPRGLVDAGGPAVVCIGPATADAARELGVRVDLVAERHTNEGLLEALVASLAAPQRGTMDV